MKDILIILINKQRIFFEVFNNIILSVSKKNNKKLFIGNPSKNSGTIIVDDMPLLFITH